VNPRVLHDLHGVSVARIVDRPGTICTFCTLFSTVQTRRLFCTICTICTLFFAGDPR